MNEDRVAAVAAGIDEQRRLADEFQIPFERSCIVPLRSPGKAFGPSWSRYRVEMFGQLMDDGPALKLDKKGRSIGTVPYFCWQVFEARARRTGPSRSSPSGYTGSP